MYPFEFDAKITSLSFNFLSLIYAMSHLQNILNIKISCTIRVITTTTNQFFFWKSLMLVHLYMMFQHHIVCVIDTLTQNNSRTSVEHFFFNSYLRFSRDSFFPLKDYILKINFSVFRIYSVPKSCRFFVDFFNNPSLYL